LTLGISLQVIFILTLETRSHLWIWRRISVGNRSKSKFVVDGAGSHEEFKLSGNISGLAGSGSTIKASWPMFRSLPGDCGTANLRSERVKVEARVVKSVMMSSGVFDMVGQVKRFTGPETLLTMSTGADASGDLLSETHAELKRAGFEQVETATDAKQGFGHWLRVEGCECKLVGTQRRLTLSLAVKMPRHAS
jgi:hypothetical protein